VSALKSVGNTAQCQIMWEQLRKKREDENVRTELTNSGFNKTVVVKRFAVKSLRDWKYSYGALLHIVFRKYVL
jgi:hypothetical protein